MITKLRKLFLLLLSFGFHYGNSQNLGCDLEEKILSQGLMDVQKEIPEILIELRYSTTNNFMKKDVYGCLNHAYLQKPVIKMLKKAQRELSEKYPGYRFLIYDACRPLSIQWELWNTLSHLSDEKRSLYVADPRKHSIHNYGSAIDLTIADENGKALDMGAGFDQFDPIAYPKKEKEMLEKGLLSKKAYENRLILRNTLMHAGITPIEYEWWHFNAYSREEAKKKYKVIE